MNTVMMSVIFTFLLASCLPQNNSSKAPTAPLDNTTHEIQKYDIEEIAEVYLEFALPISGQGIKELPVPNAGDKRRHLKKLLKDLVEGPCPKNADLLFGKLLESLHKRIEQLTEIMANSTDATQVDKLKSRIDILEELEAKIIEKKEECAAGVGQCSEQFKKHLKIRLEEVEKILHHLEEKIALEKNLLKKEYLEKMQQKLLDIKAKLQEELSQC